MGKNKKSLFGWLPWFRKGKTVRQTTETDNKPVKSSTLSLKVDKKEKKGRKLKFSSLPDIFRAVTRKKKKSKEQVDLTLGVRTLQKEASKSSLSDDELHQAALRVKQGSVPRSRASSTSTSNSEIGKERPLSKIPTPKKKKRSINKNSSQKVAVVNEIRASDNLEFSQAKLSLRHSSSSSSDSESEATKARLSMNMNRPALPIKKKDIVVNQGNKEPSKNGIVLKHYRHHRSSSSSSSNSKKKSNIQTRSVSVQVEFEPSVPVNLNSNHKLSRSSSSSSNDSKTYATPATRLNTKNPENTSQSKFQQAQNLIAAKIRKNSSSSSESDSETKHIPGKVVVETAVVTPVQRSHPWSAVTTPARRDSSSSSSSSQHEHKQVVVERPNLPDYKSSPPIVAPRQPAQNIEVNLPSPAPRKDSSSSQSSSDDEKNKLVFNTKIPDNSGRFQTTLVTPQRPNQEVVVTLPTTIKQCRKVSTSFSSSSEYDNILINKEKITNDRPVVTVKQPKIIYNPSQKLPQQPKLTTPVISQRKDRSSSSSSSDEKNKKVEVMKPAPLIPIITTPQRPREEVVKLPTITQRKERSSSSSSSDEKNKKIEVKKPAPVIPIITKPQQPRDVVVKLPSTVLSQRKERSSSSSSSDEKNKKVEVMKPAPLIPVIKKPQQPRDIVVKLPAMSQRKERSSSSSSSDEKNKKIEVKKPAPLIPIIKKPQQPRDVVVKLPTMSQRKERSSSSSLSDEKNKKNDVKKPAASIITIPQQPLDVVVKLPSTVLSQHKERSSSSSSSDEKNKKIEVMKPAPLIPIITTPQRPREEVVKLPTITQRKERSSSSSSSDEKNKKIEVMKPAPLIPIITTPQRPREEVVKLPTITQRKERSSSSSSSDEKNKKIEVKKPAPLIPIITKPQQPLDVVVKLPSTVLSQRKERSSSSSSSDEKNKKVEVMKPAPLIPVIKKPQQPREEVKVKLATPVVSQRKESSSSSSSDDENKKVKVEKHIPSISISQLPREKAVVKLPATTQPRRTDSSSSSSSSSHQRVENVARISIISSDMSQFETLDDEVKPNTKVTPEQKTNILIRQKSISSDSSDDDNNVFYENVDVKIPSHSEKPSRGSTSSSDSNKSPKSIVVPVPQVRLRSVDKETPQIKNTIQRKSSSSSDSSNSVKRNLQHTENITEIFPVIKSSVSSLKIRKKSSDSSSSDAGNSPHQYYSAEEINLADNKKTQNMPPASLQYADYEPQVISSSSSSTLSVQVDEEKKIKSTLKSSSSESSLDSLKNKSSFRTKAMEYSKMLQDKMNKKFSSHPPSKTTTEITNKSNEHLPSAPIIFKIDSPKIERERSSSSSSEDKSLNFKIPEKPTQPIIITTMKKSSSESSISDANVKNNKHEESTITFSPGPVIITKHSSSSDSDTETKPKLKDKLIHLKESLETKVHNIHLKKERKGSISSNSSIETSNKNNIVKTRSSSESSVDSFHRTRKNTEIYIPVVVPQPPVGLHVKGDSSSSHEDISQGSKKTLGTKVKEISGDIQKFFKGKPKQDKDTPSVTAVVVPSPSEGRDRSNSVLSTSSHSTMSIGESTDASTTKIKTKSKVRNVFQHMREKGHKKTHKKTSSESSHSLDSPKLNIRHKAKEFSDELKQKLHIKPKTIFKDKSDSDTPHDEDTLDSNKFIESLYEGPVLLPVHPPVLTRQSSSSSSSDSATKKTDRNTVIIQSPETIKLQQNTAGSLSSKSSSESSLNSTKQKSKLTTQTKDMFKNIKHKIYDKHDKTKKPISSSNDSLNYSGSVFYTEQHLSKTVDIPENSDKSFKAKIHFFENIAPKNKEKKVDDSSSESSDSENKFKNKTKEFTTKIRNKFGKKHDETPKVTYETPREVIKPAAALPDKHDDSSSSSDDETSRKRREVNTVLQSANHPIAYNVDVITIRDNDQTTFVHQQSVTCNSQISIPTPILRTKKPLADLTKRKSSSSSSDEEVENSNKLSNTRPSFTSSFSFSSNDDISSRENVSTDKRDSLSVMDAVANVIQQYRYSNPISPPKQSTSGTVYTFKRTAEFKSEKSLDASSKTTSQSVITTKLSPFNSLELKKDPASNVYEIKTSDVVRVKSILLESDSSASDEKSLRVVEGKKLRPAPIPPKPIESKLTFKTNKKSSSSSSSSSSEEENKKSTYEEQEAVIYFSDNNVYEC